MKPHLLTVMLAALAVIVVGAWHEADAQGAVESRELGGERQPNHVRARGQ